MGYAVAVRNAVKPQLVNCWLDQSSYLARRGFHASPRRLKPILEPRLEDHGKVIHDEYSVIRDHYSSYIETRETILFMDIFC